MLIVESPAKAKTIEKFLGRRYAVAASMGHVRDLPRSQLGVDAEQGFEPRYITIRGKGPVLAELRERVKKADRVLLATDPDREGEAISWHLCQALGLPEAGAVRITFHEITKEAVQRALAAPRPIDHQLVLAQQARRVLDRLVGYKLSPLLWKKVRGGLSAGRVQSVAVRLIVDREQERQAFQPEEYWSLTARLSPDGDRPAVFPARYHGVGGQRVELKSKAQVDGIMAEVERGGRVLRVARVARRERRRNPAPPFTTASLQQEASRKLGFGVARTMRVAQQLYEGLAVGGQHVGLVSYIRTDSVRVAEQAQGEAAEYVKGRWGEAFAFPRQGSARAGAQDAHEAIRPTSVMRTPESLGSALSRDQARLYRLIWERFLASQMAAAVYDTVTADVVAGGADAPAGAVADDAHVFRATGSTIKFAGFMTVYVEGRDERPAAGTAEAAEAEEEEEHVLPELVPGQAVRLLDLEPQQHFTEPPPRYTEAMLVRALEEKGIGRPSTYAPIIETIQQRGYVGKEDRRLMPTELGVVVTELLKEYFPSVVDVAFTAEMESELDSVESGERNWQRVVGDFYEPFAGMLARAEEGIGKVELAEDQVTDEVCEVCGRPMAVRHGRFGPFLACTGYPECNHTKPILQKTGVQCPRCGGDLVARRSRRGRTFYGCSRYPECDFVAWQRPVGLCPVCGDLMVERRGREGTRWAQCLNAACDHREGIDGESVVVPVGATGTHGDESAGAAGANGASGVRAAAGSDGGSHGTRGTAGSRGTTAGTGRRPGGAGRARAAGGAGRSAAGVAPRRSGSGRPAGGPGARKAGGAAARSAGNGTASGGRAGRVAAKPGAPAAQPSANGAASGGGASQKRATGTGATSGGATARRTAKTGATGGRARTGARAAAAGSGTRGKAVRKPAARSRSTRAGTRSAMRPGSSTGRRRAKPGDAPQA